MVFPAHVWMGGKGDCVKLNTMNVIPPLASMEARAL